MPLVPRQQVSVLFTDVAGFTDLMTNWPMRAVISSLNVYFERLSRCVYSHRGRVDKFIGDGMMAVFESPDDAVKAAQAIQQAVIRFHSEQMAKSCFAFPTRIVVGTGLVVRTAIGLGRDREWTVMGSVVNTTAHLAKTLPPDRVFISHSTFRRLTDRSALSLKMYDPVDKDARNQIVFEVTPAPPAMVEHRMSAEVDDIRKGDGTMNETLGLRMALLINWLRRMSRLASVFVVLLGVLLACLSIPIFAQDGDEPTPLGWMHVPVGQPSDDAEDLGTSEQELAFEDTAETIQRRVSGSTLDLAQTTTVTGVNGQIAYVGQNSRLYLTDPDSSLPDPSPISDLEIASAPSWSHDGTRLAFGAKGSGGILCLYIIEVATAQPPQESVCGFQRISHPFWSADDERIVFYGHQAGGADRAWVIQLGDAATLQEIGPSLRQTIFPVWLDNQHIVFPAEASPQSWALHIADINASTEPQPLPGSFKCSPGCSCPGDVPFVAYPDVSPDGSKIGFVGVRDQGRCQFVATVYLTNPDNPGQPIPVADVTRPGAGGRYGWLRWSPDNYHTSLVATGRESVGHVHVIDMNDGTIRTFDQSTPVPNGLEWAPDGSQLVVGYSDPGGDSAIHSVDAASGAFTRLVSGKWADWGTAKPEPTYTISGRVEDVNGNPIPDVTISADPYISAVTDANGIYNFTGLVSGTYTLLPTESDYPLLPPLRQVSVPPDATGQDFTGLADSDDDGLPDIWEIEGGGIDADGDGDIDLDLYAMGARPDRKDIFLEIDWLSRGDGHTHRPTQEAIENLVKAFEDAPVDDGKGINLHIEVSDVGIFESEEEGTVYIDFCGTTPNQQCPQGVTSFDAIKVVHFGDVNDTQAERNARSQVYHYALFAHRLRPTGPLSRASGHAEVLGNDLIVSLGDCTDGCGDAATGQWITRVEAEMGTLMHELGHNLGLGHGGGDSHNWKPNYLSVMNYHFQFKGIPTTNGARYDYSDEKLLPLNEYSLDEDAGIGNVTEQTKYTCSSPNPHNRLSNIRGPVPGSGPIDWNCFFDPVPTSSANINRVVLYNSRGEVSQVLYDDTQIRDPDGDGLVILEGHDDWDTVKSSLNFRNDWDWMDGYHLDLPVEPELDPETAALLEPPLLRKTYLPIISK
jgi:class 3 adenylate cyclase/Tol biopolymer transport system component